MGSLTGSNLLVAVGQASVVVVVGLIGCAVLRLSDPRGRLVVERLLLIACLLVPALGVLAPRVVPVSGVAPNGRSTERRVAAAPEATTVAVAGEIVVSAARAVPARVVGVVLATGIVARIAWLALGAMSLRRLVRRSRALQRGRAADWATAATGVQADLRVSEVIRVPAAFGASNPVVLLPAAFDSWPEGVQRALLAHELVHVRRRDWPHAVADELVKALLWFQPAAWWLVRRIRLSREHLVDREVVRLTGDRSTYLDALIRLASQDADPLPVTVPAFFRRPQLARRVSHLVKEVPMSRRRLVTSLVVVTLMVVVATGAAVRAMPLEAARVSPAAPQAAGVPPSPATGLPVQPPLPEPLMTVAAEYPDRARAAGVVGPVVMVVTTRADGVPALVEPVSGAPELIDAAVSAAYGWRFAPSDAPHAIVIGLNVLPEATDAATEAKRIGGSGGPAKPPAKVVHHNPVYPASAKEAGVQGLTILQATIGSDGRVARAHTLRTSGDAHLDAAAADAVLRWEYEPTYVEGRAVAVIMTITLNFQLQ